MRSGGGSRGRNDTFRSRAAFASCRSGPLPVCEVLAALVPERVLPFASGGSRKRWLKPSPSGPNSRLGNRGGAPKGERARSRGPGGPGSL
jgi:hypothetical protein